MDLGVLVFVRIHNHHENQSSIGKLASKQLDRGICHYINKSILPVPPIRWARGGATSTENTFIETIQFGTIGNRLQIFLYGRFTLFLEVWLDTLVLFVKIGKVLVIE
jgi:hypothetical protein